MPTVVTISDESGTARHEINFKGFSGIVFWVFLGSFMLFIIAFATEGNNIHNTVHIYDDIWWQSIYAIGARLIIVTIVFMHIIM